MVPANSTSPLIKVARTLREAGDQRAIGAFDKVFHGTYTGITDMLNRLSNILVAIVVEGAGTVYR